MATENTDGPAMSLMHVVLLPGEVTYAIATRTATRPLHPQRRGEQMVDDSEPRGRPRGRPSSRRAVHSTVNTGWEPLSLAIYGPAGAEEALKGLPDHRELPAGEVPRLTRS